jgi:formylglycine-generating enzyme required for sulfatase activity
VFISYPHQEKTTADAACAKLEAEGIRCWIAPRDIAPSAEWAGAIIDAIDLCRVMVLIFSAHTNQSKQVRREVQQAFEGEKPVVPFRIENVNPEKSLRFYIGPVHWLDALTPPLEKHLEKLTASVRGLVQPAIDNAASSAAPPITPEASAQQERMTQAEANWRSEGRIKIDARIMHGAPDGWFKPGAGKVEWFQDQEHGPEMVVVPAGEFIMGSPKSEPERSAYEGPLHRVKFTRPFAVARHAITRGQFTAFVNNTNYNKPDGDPAESPGSEWRDPGFRQDDAHPVVAVSWDDARAYLAWLSQATGQTYRLLSEAEWEYVARAGTTTPFWWGSSITVAQANYDGNYVYKGGGAKGGWRKATVRVGSFEANPWGLYDVHGNVWEWCEDIWHGDYYGAPPDGSPWHHGGDARHHVVRGAGWTSSPESLRSASRNRHNANSRNLNLGFRVARTFSG